MLELGEAHAISDLIEAAHSAEKQFDGQVWFRGHTQHDWKLVPTAHRRHAVLEAQFANHFRLRAPSMTSSCPEHKDYVSWLPLMQHYGLPTRLLDWTESLLVAAYFAIPCETSTSSAAVWILAPGNLNRESIGYLIPFLTDERVAPVVNEAFSGKQSNNNQHSIAVLAPRTDRRMAAQLGNYTIHGDRNALEMHSNAASFLAKIVIPSKAHDKVRADLSVSGMRLSSLFPDLSNLAKEISELKALDQNGEDLVDFNGA